MAERLRERILNGTYAYGDRLSPERRLCDEFSVSRATVRNALSLLEESKLITRRASSGTFVIYRDPAEYDEDVAEITSPLELNVVRTIIEPEMVRLAVINMTAKDLAELAEALAQLEEAKQSASEFSRWDETFHLQLAVGTHNPLLISIYRQINEVRNHAQWFASKEKILTPARIAEYNRQHRALFEAIRSRDIETAMEVTALHMKEIQRDLLADTEALCSRPQGRPKG